MDISFVGIAGFCLFLQYCMEDGQVLEFYKDWLRKQPIFIGKPLGLCLYCNMFWISLLYYIFQIHFFSFLGLVYLTIKLWKTYIKI